MTKKTKQTTINLAKGFQGRWFEKEALKILKEKYKFVFNIKHPTDYFCYNAGDIPHLIEVKFSRSKYFSPEFSKFQYKYATHFLFKTSEGIKFVKKEDLKKVNARKGHWQTEEQYLRKNCKKYIKLMERFAEVK